MSETGTFSDGSPIPTHTYDMVEYQPTTNRFVPLMAFTYVPGTTYAGVAHLLNLDHLTADRNQPSMWKRSPARRNGSANASGDVVKATIIGDEISLYINGQLMARATDDTFASGQPGIGFFTRPGGNSAHLALTRFTASTLP